VQRCHRCVEHAAEVLAFECLRPQLARLLETASEVDHLRSTDRFVCGSIGEWRAASTATRDAACDGVRVAMACDAAVCDGVRVAMACDAAVCDGVRVAMACDAAVCDGVRVATSLA
jgi:hypothetical protein